MTALDLTALGVFGIALTGAVLGFASPKMFMAAAGGPGVPPEMALLDGARDGAIKTASTRFGGKRPAEDGDPSWASFPRAF